MTSCSKQPFEEAAKRAGLWRYFGQYRYPYTDYGIEVINKPSNIRKLEDFLLKLTTNPSDYLAIDLLNPLTDSLDMSRRIHNKQFYPGFIKDYLSRFR